MIHTPNGSLHFQQKWSAVAFVLLQLSADIWNDTVLTIRFDLGQYGTKAPWLFVITKAGIHN
jgi:hypothetical protein